jgi:hypothetical protein
MEFMLLIWIACPVICGIVASAKNRSGLGWAALGLLFGFLAVICLAMLPAKTA